MSAQLRNRSFFQSPPASAGPAAVDDRALVARARVDRQAFAEIYERYVDSIYWYCHGRLGDATAAEDATSQVFMKALVALPRYQEQERDTAFRAWLFRIAHNVIIDDVRARRGHAPLDTIADLSDGGDLPEETVIRDEAQRHLWDLVAMLPPEQRNVVTLRLVGLSGAEIASVLGRGVGAINTAQCRAVARLRSLGQASGHPDRPETGHDWEPVP